MSTSQALAAVSRTITGKKTRELRAQSLVPAVMYGRGQETRLLTVPSGVFKKVFQAAGESTLVDLSVDNGAPVKVLIHEVQRDAVTGDIEHVDFYQVNMTEKLETTIPLTFVGEAKAVKELGGVFVKVMDHVPVTCLPQDLVHEIEVDISKLATFEDALHIKDVAAPKGIEITSDPEEVIALVQAIKEEVETPAEPVDVSQVEVEKKGKKEEEGADAAK